MGVSAFMQAGEPIVEPGGTATRVVKIRNTGQVVDNVLIDIVGDTAPWTTVEPSSLNLFPGDEGQVTVTFAPPKSASVRAGVVPFAVRIVSSEDTAGSVVEEGEIEVAAFTELAAEIVPRTIRLKRRGKAEIAVDNVGNRPVDVQLVLEDPDGKVKGGVDPGMLTLEPGKATFADITVKPRKTFWRGTPQTLPYQVAVVSEGGSAPLFADGVILQEQILPKWLFRVLMALLALALILFILYQTLFKSVIESAARDAAQEEAAAATDAAEQAQETADEAAAAADDVAQAAEAAGIDVPGVGDDGGPTTTVPGGENGNGNGNGTGNGSVGDLLQQGDAAEFRIVSNAPSGTTQTFAAIGQPADEIFLLTDVILQNPTGDLGTMQILKGGQPVIVIGLENFRDLDYHFVAPIQFDPGQALSISVTCRNAAPGNTGPCTAAATFSGVLVAPPPPTTLGG
jgi:hypothetical protein